MNPDRPYQLMLAGKHGVGKTRIFYELQRLVDSTGEGDLTTVSTGTHSWLGEDGQREKWMVHTTTRGSGVTVRRILMCRLGHSCICPL